MPRIDTVWQRIVQHQGQEFRQKQGQTFTYEVSGAVLRPSTTNRNLPRSTFEAALEHVPLKNTVPLQSLQGPSYLYAILMDPRISASEW